MDRHGGGEKEIVDLGAEKLVSVKKVAEMMDVSVRQIWRLVAAGQFPSPVHVGHAARWRWSEVQGYLEGLRHD